MDSLRRRVLARDRLRNSPREMEVTARETATTLICVACRKVPDERGLYLTWLNEDSRHTWHDWPGLKGKCPDCGSRLASVTW